MYGKDFDLKDDRKILAIKPPRKKGHGPCEIVYKNLCHRWVLVTLLWDGAPRLGVRWFHGRAGYPYRFFFRVLPRWFVVPPELNEAMLASLEKCRKLDTDRAKEIRGFLCCEKKQRG